MPGLNGKAVQDKVKDAQKKIIEFWKKYDKKQKTLIISITMAVILAIIILAVIITRPNYVELITCDDTLAASEVKTALDGSGYKYQITNNGLTFKVLEADLNNATYLIAQGGYTASGYDETSINDALSGGFSSTSSDKDRLYQKYLEDKMKNVLEGLDFVNSAKVTFSLPAEKLSFLAKKEETSVAVTIDLRGSLPDGAGSSMANYIAAAVGNDTTNNIVIIDSQGNVLFQGNATDMVEGVSASEREKIMALYENRMIDNINRLVARTPLYQEVAVSPSFEYDFTLVNKEEIEYSNPNNLKINDYIYEMSGGSVSGGIPGTDSNDNDTTYTISGTDGSQTTVNIQKNQYALNSITQTTEGIRGTLIKDQSSMAIVLRQYVVYNEDDVRQSGQLDNMTWEEFKQANGASTEIAVQDSYVEMLKKGSIDDISVIAYQVPMFNDSEASQRTIRDYLPIILAVVILAMLGFVVWKSLKPVEVTEVDAGLSVDELLTATQEAQAVEDIDLNEKSEVRKAIEKFVDENPEAVALLLRNWLNDDWE